MNRTARFGTMACLLALAAALPLAAEGASRRQADAGQDRKGRFPFGSTLTLGLVVGHTLTPDYRTGFDGIANVGPVKHDAWPELGLPALEAHNVYRASYSRPARSFPLLGAFAETELTSRLSLQASILIRELTEEIDRIWSETSQRLYSASERRFYHADFERSRHAPTAIWEIPVLVKYRFGVLQGKAARVRPFLAAGPAFWLERDRSPEKHYRVRDPHHGMVAGLGFEVHWQGWCLAPQAS